MTDLTYEDLHDLADGPVTDVACPLCGPKARHGSNRTRKVMRIWDSGDGLLTYNCERCNVKGWARNGSVAFKRDAPRAAEPKVITDNTDLARQIWLTAQPLQGSPAEAYLNARRCPSPWLRYAPARGHRPHAMVAQFQGTTGIHLTYLRPDGSGKADVDKPKIMLGPSKGHPIWVRDNPERAELVIAEGIEDAATLGNIMNCTAWAAGSAGRIASIVPHEGWDNVWVAVDLDEAGANALRGARRVREVIPLHIGRALGARDRVDANKALLMYGPEVLSEAIDWCDIQAALAQGKIGLNQHQARMERLQRLMAA